MTKVQQQVDQLNRNLSGAIMLPEELYQWERTVARILAERFNEEIEFTLDDDGFIRLVG